MKKTLIQLKEYDIITTKKEYEHHANIVWVNKKTFQIIEERILNYKESVEQDAIDFLTMSSKRDMGKIIRAKNYVGLLQINEQIQLQIVPKIDGGTNEDSKKTFIKMLKSLKDFPSKNFAETHLKSDRLPIFEIFIRLFISELQKLVKKGLKSSYYEMEDNLKVFKGKMNFKNQIKYNIIHKERFYMNFDEFGLDSVENRLLATTLQKLLKLSDNENNIKDLRKLLISFEGINNSTEIEKDFLKVVSNRGMKEYEIALAWSKVFLKNESFTPFSGESFGQSLLFPMEKIFEDYVAKQLKQLLHNKDWTISLQDKKYYLFENKFGLRPDIVMTNVVTNRTIVIDTKWKLLKNKSAINYNISQADMYQMYAYAKKYNTDEIYLFYPINDEFSGNEDIYFVSEDDLPIKVFIYFVDCHNIGVSINNFLNTYFIK